MTLSDADLAEQILKDCAWLDGHGTDLRPLFMAFSRPRLLGPGEWSHGEGDDKSGLVIVLRGALQLFAQAPGDRSVMAWQIGPGGAIGQTARFGGGPRLVTAISVGETLILQATDTALARMAQVQPQVWKAIASLQYVLLREMAQTIAETVALPPRQRLAARLLRFARAQRDDTELHLSQQALGEMTGLSRKTVNLYLAEFERDGLIAATYGAIRLRDFPGLEKVAALPGNR